MEVNIGTVWVNNLLPLQQNFLFIFQIFYIKINYKKIGYEYTSQRPCFCVIHSQLKLVIQKDNLIH